MNKQNEAFYELKRVYLEGAVPDALEESIRRGIHEGKNRPPMDKAIKNRNRRKGARSATVAAAAVMMILILSLNLSPAFAEQMSGIPLLGQLVKVLIFTGGSAGGGEITDGTNISGVQAQKIGTAEVFTIHFEQGDQPQELAGSYAVHHAENPDTISFQISGVRMFSATEDFEALKSSALVKDVYPIITLDDSMVRFMIVFKEPVNYEVKEMKSPASLVLQVSPAPSDTRNTQLFSVRTMDMPRGESLGMTEEILMNAYPQRRILHAAAESESFFIELGQFETEKEAEEALKLAKTTCPDAGLYIEKVQAK